MKKVMFVMLLTMLGMVITSNVSNGQSWKINYSTDEFGDTTNESYVVSIQYGNFSNSATNHSKLDVVVFLNNDDNSDTNTKDYLKIFEYGDYPADFDYNTIKLKIKDDAGNVYQINATVFRKYVFIDDKIQFRKLLQNNSKLKCYFSDKDEYSPSYYHFVIDTDNFNEIYNEWQGSNNSTNSNKLNNTNN